MFFFSSHLDGYFRRTVRIPNDEWRGEGKKNQTGILSFLFFNNARALVFEINAGIDDGGVTSSMRLLCIRPKKK